MLHWPNHYSINGNTFKELCLIILATGFLPAVLGSTTRVFLSLCMYGGLGVDNSLQTTNDAQWILKKSHAMIAQAIKGEGSYEIENHEEVVLIAREEVKKKREEKSRARYDEIIKQFN